MNPWIIAIVVGGGFYLLQKLTPASASTTPLAPSAATAAKPSSGSGGGSGGGTGGGFSAPALNPPSWQTPGTTSTPYGGALDGTDTVLDSGGGTEDTPGQTSAVYGSTYDDNQFTQPTQFDGIDFGDVTDDSSDDSYDDVGGGDFE